MIGLTLLSAVVHGSLDGRWSAATDLKAQGAELASLPDKCGDWEVVSKPELDQGAMDMLRCFGADQRVYRNEKTDALVNVAIFFGPRGPIAVHTPEVCYDSVGTEQKRERRVETVSTATRQHELWSVEFASKDNPTDQFEVWYAWSDGDNFDASKHPRFWMTDNLYKIQLSGPVAEGTNQPIQDFLKHFLAQLETKIQ